MAFFGPPPPFVGATSSVAGSPGLVPQPSAGKQNSVLVGDSTFLNINSIQLLPDQVANCVLWLRSDDVVTSGSNVTTWNNKANSSFNAVQTADATKQPTLVSNQINGHSAVRFDGTNDCLQVSNFAIRAQFTALLVLKQADAVNKPFFIEHSAQAGTNDGFYMYGTAPAILVDRANSVSRTTVSSTWAGTSWSIFTYKIGDGAFNWIVLLDGTGISFNSGNALVGNNDLVTTTLNIGSRNNGASIATSADHAEIIIYNRVLWDFEICAVTNYLKARYAL